MPVIQCPINDCSYTTDDVDASVAAALLIVHNNVHVAATRSVNTKQKPPKLDRPKISKESSEETWNAFQSRWSMFKESTALTPRETVQQLFQCCDNELGEDILRSHKSSIAGTEDGLLKAIKKLAVIPVAVSVRRSELISMKQDHGENARSFFARINGKAATCSYSIKCERDTCAQVVDFTEVIVKDVLVTGLSDDEIRKDVLGWSELDTKNATDTVTFIEAKEMARDALQRPPSAAAISTYKGTNRVDAKPKSKAICRECSAEMERLIWSRRQRKMIECVVCLSCWKKANTHKMKGKDGGNSKTGGKSTDETNALFIGNMEIAVTESSTFTLKIAPVVTPGKEPSKKSVVLDHHIFDSHRGWRKAESMQHPTLRLRLTTEKEDYDHIGSAFPKVSPSHVTVVTDTGAQSCLWSRKDFFRCGFQLSDLIHVKRTMLAANREEIDVDGAIFIRLSGIDYQGRTHTASVMVYVSPSTERFYLSREALVQLGVISKDFPQIGATIDTCSVEHQKSACGCPMRALPPAKLDNLPYPCVPENNTKMKEWLINRFASSTFNKCPHQKLVGMTGPDIKFHIDPHAIPVAVKVPAMVPLHWQEQVEKQIKEDVAMGVLEEVPFGEPSLWCHRMVLTRKADGTPRRTVDLSPLNKHCLRETHYVKPPFQQAKAIPPKTWKTVTDAWNGYHSVPICKEDRHLTTFITPWGRYRYKVAPQGFLASGDGYARRFDDVISDVLRKTKCVDDTVMWDAELEEHWWRVTDFLELVGRNGIILNENKFQFARKEIDFAGFHITDETIQPAQKFLKAIQDFPTPTRITDIRSWFGLVHQVAHYDKLVNIMEPFRHLLSSKARFAWSEGLEAAFQKSKVEIVYAIKKGVEIFDLKRRTCLRSDWSKTGIGYFLMQKHCDCAKLSPGCCDYGWRITLAGSRFLRPAETRYAPVEGEALAIAWALEQTKYFTQGCDNLLVVTDHNPLVKLLGDRTLDEISNSRLFSIKQRTLPWRFSIEYMPGKGNFFSDATSRYPAGGDDVKDDLEISSSEILAGLRIVEDIDDSWTLLAASSDFESKHIRAITWELVKEETVKDPSMGVLTTMIETIFPEHKKEMPPHLEQYWPLRDQLFVLDGVILMRDRVVIPPSLRSEVTQSYITDQGTRVLIPSSLRPEVLQSLHAAHQGVSSMNERAKASVYWPGITKDIQTARDTCSNCNKIAPSQARTPPIEPWIPTTPFEAIACDYFNYMGCYYFVAADRLSGWTEQQRIKVGTNEAGAQGLCKALRRIFVTFGVPIEVASDGGPEFVATETVDFFKRWGVRHRLSSVEFPSSNGRAELAVKATKRLLMKNVGPNGCLDNDKMVRALLTQRNTPDPGCSLSPAQILFGRPLKDTLPYIKKNVMTFNNPQINNEWKKAWRLKEETMKARYVKSLENLSEHARQLPPLRHGDHVFLQNQSGRYAKRWDRSGVVAEVRDNDQYVVKVAGSGRMTLRNRRFLKKYEPHLQQGPLWRFEYPVREPSAPTSPSSSADATEKFIPSPVSTATETDTPNNSVDFPPSSRAIVTITESESVSTTPLPEASPEPGSPPVEQLPSSTPAVEPSAQRISNMSSPHRDNNVRRSTRDRKKTKFYDPSTGKYTEQNPQ